MLRQGLGATLTLVLVLACGAGLAWGAAGVVNGLALPVPSVTNPMVGQQYDVELQLSNASISNSSPPGIAFITVNVASAAIPPSPDEVAHIILACSTEPCGANELPGTVAFIPVGPTGCVSAAAGVVSCEIDSLNSNRVLIKTNPLAVTLGPLQFSFPLATIRVQQLTRPVTFFMQGDASYFGIAGTCTGGQCSNIQPDPPATSCTQDVPDCDFSALAGAVVGTVVPIPLDGCGDSILDPGETCDPPGSVLPGGSTCRDDCTFCGDGLVQGADGEACDDGNNLNGDGCSATCQVELCQVKVDKQVSCDGVTWADAGLELNNEDGTNGVTCPGGAPVFVRYQVANTGQVDVANCTLSESSSVINAGGVVQSGFSILAGVTLPETAADSDQTCTADLTAQEPNTASLSCECQFATGPLAVIAADTATVACEVITVGICRPPGFWAEHAGTEKNRSVNITQAVIDAAGGCIVVCGEKITNTDTDSANSALEAMCVTGQLQLPRQLMAAALNCVMTNGDADCTGTGVEDIFQACNAACPASGTVVIGPDTIDCIDAIGCFNNGGQFDPATGACLPDANNCHDQPLCNESLGLCFDPPGPAGSSGACNAARHNSCAIIQPGEAQCVTGTKDVPPETCP